MTASALIDPARGEGTQRATLGFDQDPRAGDPQLTVRGWTEP